jgi:hypothetical protein
MILLYQIFTGTKTQKKKKRKKKHVLPPLPSLPLHIPLMHHLTCACTAAAAHAMQVSVPVCGECVHAQQRCNLDDRMEWNLQRARQRQAIRFN